jgi:hypothetical protein
MIIWLNYGAPTVLVTPPPTWTRNARRADAERSIDVAVLVDAANTKQICKNPTRTY